MDESLFAGEYADGHMMLLRNKFFKSCAFKTKLQKWVKDKNITLAELKARGFVTLADDVTKIVMVTTPNSLKYLKFVGGLSEKNIKKWTENADGAFGVVKWDKPTRFFHERMVQSSYQLLNTLGLSEEQTAQLLQPSVDYISLLRGDIDFMRYHFTDAFAREKDGEVVESQNGTLNGTKTEGNKDFAELEEIEDIVPPKEWWQKIEEAETLPPKDGEEYKELMSQSELNLVHIDSISDNYFEGNTAIERIKLSDNVIVGSSAFTGCTNLREVTGKIKEVAYKGFYNCTQISEIDLSETTSIGEKAFYKCTNLSDIKLTKIKEIYYDAFVWTSFRSLELCPCSVINSDSGTDIGITLDEMIISGGEINNEFSLFIQAIVNSNKEHALKITVRNITLKEEFDELMPFKDIGKNVELIIEDEGSYNALIKDAGSEKAAFNDQPVQKLWDQA